MSKLTKNKIIKLFEENLDEIMNQDKKMLADMPLMIKSKMSQISQNILEQWANEMIVEDNRDNTIITDEKKNNLSI